MRKPVRWKAGKRKNQGMETYIVSLSKACGNEFGDRYKIV